MNKADILTLLDDIVEMYFQFDCSLEECIEWAREVVEDVTRTVEYAREE